MTTAEPTPKRKGREPQPMEIVREYHYDEEACLRALKYILSLQPKERKQS